MTYQEMIDKQKANMKKASEARAKLQDDRRTVRTKLLDYVTNHETFAGLDSKASDYYTKQVELIDHRVDKIIVDIATRPIKWLHEHRFEIDLLRIVEPLFSNVGLYFVKLAIDAARKDDTIKELTQKLNEANVKLANSQLPATSNKVTGDTKQ